MLNTRLQFSAFRKIILLENTEIGNVKTRSWGGSELEFNIFFFHKGLSNGSEMYIKSKTEESVFLKILILLVEIAKTLTYLLPFFFG